MKWWARVFGDGPAVRPWAGGCRNPTLRCAATALGAAMFLGSACAPPPAPANGSTRPVQVRRPAAGPDTAPSGSLRQEQISVRLAVGALRIEVTPLADWVLEAAAPDTRDRLRQIAESHDPEVARSAGADEPVLFLVSFTSREAGTGFLPDALHMLSRGLRHRPAAIRAITPDWGSRRLAQQSTEMAVYAYGRGLDLTRRFTVEYEGVEDSSWSVRLTAIEAERARIGLGPGDAPQSFPGRSSSRP